MLRVGEQSYRTDTGRQRTANEDSYFARPPLFAVADGMGGAQAGEVASRIAAEAFEPAEAGEGEAPEAFLRRIARTANRQIHSLSQHDSSRSGMGTTLTAALVDGEDVVLGHVGDSRAYRFREDELTLLTQDHSLVEELRRQGRLTDEQAEDHPQRSIITRALGPESDVEVDTMTFRAKPGDVYLLCSDGLTTMIKEPRIAEVLAGAASLDAATAQLVSEANEAGGRDNITCVAFRLEEAEVPAEEEVPDSDKTLVGVAAAEAGLTGEAVQQAAARQRREAKLGGAASAGGPSPTAPRRRGRFVAKVVVGLLIVAALGALAYVGNRQVYFIGTDEQGRLALYRGLPYDLPLGVELYSEVLSAPVRVVSLPQDRRDEATNHELRGRDDAVDLLEDLEASAVTAEPTESGTGNAAGNGNATGNGANDGGPTPNNQPGAGNRQNDAQG